MSAATLTAGILGAALLFYALTGGADFGGGVFDLLASGPRKAAQRRLIAHAIGPIWEANHVWLILVVVLLFVGFPGVYAALSVHLHVPLTLMLVGVVLRGAAFVFRAYDPQPGRGSIRWQRVFAITSALTPLALGVTLGAAASGQLRAAAPPTLFALWTRPFPLAIGALVLVLFALLAAVYLTVEADEPALKDDFRRRALACTFLLGALAWLGALLSEEGAPRLHEVLLRGSGALVLQGLCALTAAALVAALLGRRYQLARLVAGALTVLVVGGFLNAQRPYVLFPEFPIEQAAAAPPVLRAMLLTLAVGSALLVPALFYLFRIFKHERAERARHEPS
ncbi:MAG: cytochrome d ubiquinol oxidase subunit II [Polyangia bacterium]